MDLIREDWLYLLRLLSSAGAIFAPGPTEREVLNQTLWKTVWFHKMEESLLVPSFTRGDLRTAWFPSRYSPQAARQALKKLKQRHVLSMRPTGRVKSELRVRVEAAGMLCSLTYLFPKQQVLIDLREKLLSFWSFNRWEVDAIILDKGAAKSMNIDEVEAVGKEQSKQAMAKKRAKMALIPADDIKGSAVRGIMRAACEVLEIKYLDLLPTVLDKKRAKGSADNFIRYCKDEGVNPRQLLGDVCEHWHRMRVGAMMDAEGRPIHLSSSVSFMEFFRYRNIIIDWLSNNKDSAPKHRIKLTWRK